MKYIFVPSIMVIYGLLVNYNIYIPVRYHTEYTGNIFIIMGMVFFLLIPFAKKIEKEEKFNKKELFVNDKCLFFKIIGFLLLISHLFEIYENDYIFILGLVFIIACQSIIEFFNKD